MDQFSSSPGAREKRNFTAYDFSSVSVLKISSDNSHEEESAPQAPPSKKNSTVTLSDMPLTPTVELSPRSKRAQRVEVEIDEGVGIETQLYDEADRSDLKPGYKGVSHYSNAFIHGARQNPKWMLIGGGVVVIFFALITWGSSEKIQQSKTNTTISCKAGKSIGTVKACKASKAPKAPPSCPTGTASCDQAMEPCPYETASCDQATGILTCYNSSIACSSGELSSNIIKMITIIPELPESDFDYSCGNLTVGTNATITATVDYYVSLLVNFWYASNSSASYTNIGQYSIGSGRQTVATFLPLENGTTLQGLKVTATSICANDTAQLGFSVFPPGQGPAPGPNPTPDPPTPPPPARLLRRLFSWLFFSEDVEDQGAVDVANRECKVPEQRNAASASSWSYYDGLIEKNRHTAFLARSVQEYTPRRELDLDDDLALEEDRDEEDDKSFIPHRLVFTHKENLLDCDVSSSVESEPSLHTFAHNVRDTIKAYEKVWADDLQVTFLTDVECRKALYAAKPELLKYYDDLEGMFKGDLCRSADLYLNGGYYFDVDLLVVHPFVASPSNKFVTVKWPWYEKDPQFFQAFIAAAPRNKIIMKSLVVMLELLSGKRAKRGGGAMHMIGTQAMQDAWAETAQEDSSLSLHGKNKEVYLLSEHRIGDKSYDYNKLPTQLNDIKPGFTDSGCNYFVADDDKGSIYFFSRILGTTFCGGKQFLSEGH